jgi:hypothetical protein
MTQTATIEIPHVLLKPVNNSLPNRVVLLRPFSMCNRTRQHDVMIDAQISVVANLRNARSGKSSHKAQLAVLLVLTVDPILHGWEELQELKRRPNDWIVGWPGACGREVAHVTGGKKM